jgi:hypothetical protein
MLIKILMHKIYFISCGSARGKIFLDDSDFLRFSDYLFYFNNKNRSPLKKLKRLGAAKREEVVKIICYSITQKGFYFLAAENGPGNLDNFIRRIKTGYAMYFNQKHKLRRSLFEDGCCKKEPVSSSGIEALSKYIHLKPINDFCFEKDGQSAYHIKKFLRSYPWSSLKHYLNLTKNDLVSPGQELGSFIPDHEKAIDDFVDSIYG